MIILSIVTLLITIGILMFLYFEGYYSEKIPKPYEEFHCLEVGQIWQSEFKIDDYCHIENPFERQERIESWSPVTSLIVDIKDGWVQYKLCSSDDDVITLHSRIDDFKENYTKLIKENSSQKC